MYKVTLQGHISPESAYVVNDYPYSFRLRCKIRYWIETKKGFGQRFCSQTLNPKTGTWNKPKASTYEVIIIMILNEQDHVTYETLQSGGWSSEEEIIAFELRHGSAIGEYEKAAIRYIRATNKANSMIKTTISEYNPDIVPQTHEEQAAIYSAAIRKGYTQVLAEGK